MNPLNKPAFWLLSLAQYHHASTENNQAMCNLVPRLHAPAFLTRCEKSWGVEPGNEANAGYERFRLFKCSYNTLISLNTGVNNTCRQDASCGLSYTKEDLACSIKCKTFEEEILHG